MAEKRELSFDDINGRCGFCKEFGGCLSCPLSPQYCVEWSFNYEPVFYQIIEGLNTDNYERVEELCRGMLNEILCYENYKGGRR